MADFDIIVLGSGPAGMKAARTAADKGASVLLLDEQARPGGQIYRDVQSVDPARAAILGNSYTEGRPLADAIDHQGIRHIPGATVWRVEETGLVCYSADGKGVRATGSHIIVATGAIERPVPVPGWTLPGVMTAGAAQILLKSSGLVPERSVVAGSGPLLYLVASQLAAAGAPPIALVETQGAGNWLKALPFIPGALVGWNYLSKGREMMRQIAAARIPRYTGAKDIRVEGDDKAEAISFESGGHHQRIDCDTVLLHAGVVPNTQISRSLRLDHQWDDRQKCFRPVIDEWGQTSLDNISIAGDGGGIGGALAAAIQGQIAALHALSRTGLIGEGERDAEAAPLRIELTREMAARPFLDVLFQAPDEIRIPGNETLVCRCEEVTAGKIREYASQGCIGPNQTKAFGRPGMGPCQGRYCGLTVTEILSDEHQQHPDETGAFRIRAPLKPIDLGELAAMAPEGLELAPEHLQKH